MVQGQQIRQPNNRSIRDVVVPTLNGSDCQPKGRLSADLSSAVAEIRSRFEQPELKSANLPPASRQEGRGRPAIDGAQRVNAGVAVDPGTRC